MFLDYLFWTLLLMAQCSEGHLHVSPHIIAWTFIVHYALSVQLELRGRFFTDDLCVGHLTSGYICFLFHSDTSLRHRVLLMLPSQCPSRLSFPFILLLLCSCLGARHTWTNATVSNLCSCFPSSKYSNLPPAQPYTLSS